MNERQHWMQRLEAFSDYLQHERRVGGSSQRQYASIVERWIDFALLHGHDPSTYDQGLIDELLDRQRVHSDGSRAGYSSNLSVWCRWASSGSHTSLNADAVNQEQYGKIAQWMERLETYVEEKFRGQAASTIGNKRPKLEKWIKFACSTHWNPAEWDESVLGDAFDKWETTDTSEQREFISGLIRAWCDYWQGRGAAEVAKCWLVRAGSEGEAVDHNIDNDVVSIGYGYQGDLGSLAKHATTCDELGDHLDEQFGHLSAGKRRRTRDEVWRFVREIQSGDLVVMPMKSEGADAKPIAVGRVDGPYEFDSEQSEQVRCRRPVTWLRKGIERSAIREDLRSSLNARHTVLELHQHDAARRIQHLASQGFDPGPRNVGAPADQDQSVRLAQLVAEFRATGYPSDDDRQHKQARAEFERLLQSLPEIAHDSREAVNAIWNIAEFDYGSVGYAGASANELVNNASEQEWTRVRSLLTDLCFGDHDEAVRLDKAADSEELPGVRYVIGARLLAISHPQRFIPVYVLRSVGKYPGVIDMIETLDQLQLIDPDLIDGGSEYGLQDLLSLSGTDLNAGTAVMLANDLLLSTLRPYFLDDDDVDTWGMSRFLYWLMERHPSDGDADEPWIDEINLAVLADDLLCEVGFLEEIVELLEDKGQVILYGPPGTGKTYFAQRLARALVEGARSDDPAEGELGPANSDAYSLVQFHPAYSYEDFFEGFRPAVDDAGNMTYWLTPGPLVRIADAAQANPEQRYVMVIDEINRANLPRVLGELLFLLEYRDRAVHTQYRSESQFSLPENLWFIGTMNTADRSIALIDAAMRRRFHFVPFFPNHGPTAGLLHRWMGQHAPGQRWIADLVDAVNDQLAAEIGGDHLLIGPSHFMKRNLDTEALRRIWLYNIEPLIEDQLFGRQEAIESFRFDAVWKRHGPDATSPRTQPGASDDAAAESEQASDDEGLEGQDGE